MALCIPGMLGQATDPPGPAPVEHIFSAGEWYQSHWLGVGAAQAQEALAADGAGHHHPGHQPVLLSHVWFNAEISTFSHLT